MYLQNKIKRFELDFRERNDLIRLSLVAKVKFNLGYESVTVVGSEYSSTNMFKGSALKDVCLTLWFNHLLNISQSCHRSKKNWVSLDFSNLTFSISLFLQYMKLVKPRIRIRIRIRTHWIRIRSQCIRIRIQSIFFFAYFSHIFLWKIRH